MAAIVMIVLVLGSTVALFGAESGDIPLGRGAARLRRADLGDGSGGGRGPLSGARRTSPPAGARRGWSLLNDGTAIIFFTLALGATRRRRVGDGRDGLPLHRRRGRYLGAVIGLAVDLGIRQLHDPTLEVMLTTIAAYGSFVAAEGGGIGVIATVTAGMLCGSSEARSGLVGAGADGGRDVLGVSGVRAELARVPADRLRRAGADALAHWRAILAAYLVVTLSRAIVTSGLSAILPPRLRIPPQWTAILAWGGLRGALSMVLALSIPASFPQRDLLITMTFGVVILSILTQGITVGPALRWLGLTGPGEPADYDETQAAFLGAYSALEELGRTGGRWSRTRRCDTRWPSNTRSASGTPSRSSGRSRSTLVGQRRSTGGRRSRPGDSSMTPSGSASSTHSSPAR